jgi:hypothetical protein
MRAAFSLRDNSSERGLLAANDDYIRCLGVEVSASGIRQWSSNRISNIIARDQIRQITLCSGTDVKYPFCQYVLGLALFSIGLLGLAVSLLEVIGRGYIVQVQSNPGVIMLPLTPLGLLFIAGIGFWVLASIFSVKYFFMIETQKGAHKISFGKPTDVEEIRRFIWKMKMSFGYVIDIANFPTETQSE